MAERIRSQSFRVWATLFALGAVLILSRADLLGGAPGGLLSDVRNDGPNAVGMDLITQNYYEELLKIDREPEWKGTHVARAIVNKVSGKRAIDENAVDTRVSLAVLGGTIDHETGFLEHSLKPDVDIIHQELPFRTNRWGHRDTDDYDKEPAPGVFRIALVGSSNSMAYGVEMHDGFEQLLEHKLEETLPAMGGFEHYEIINFSVSKYHLLERVYVARWVAPEFKPRMMLVEVTMRDMRRAVYQALARRVSEGRDLGFDFTREIVRRSGANPKDSPLKVEQRLRRFTEELVTGCFQELGRIEDETGIMVVPMLMRLEVEATHANLVQMGTLAENAGLTPIRVFDAYEGQSAAQIYLRGEDFHPSPLGHRLLTEEIYADMLAEPAIKRALLDGGGPAAPSP